MTIEGGRPQGWSTTSPSEPERTLTVMQRVMPGLVRLDCYGKRL